MSASPVEVMAALPLDEVAAMVQDLSDDQVDALLADWTFYARPEQLAPDWLWRWWVVVTGRGWGKNRTGSEWVVGRCEQFAAARHPHHFGLMNSTFTAVQALQIEGESGLKAVCDRKGYRLEHPSTALSGDLIIPLPGGGEHVSTFEIHTADIPDRVRGRNFHTTHADELAAWRHKVDAEGGTAFTNMDFALRSLCPPGTVPQGLVTTTPKPIKLVKQLLAGFYGATAVTRGRLYDNAANLAPDFIRAILRTYAGTRLGRQEVDGLVLDDVEGALWRLGVIQEHRLDLDVDELPVLARPVVAVDPPAERTGDECGIVVAAASAQALADGQRHGYVLEDLSVGGMAPEGWAQRIVDAFHRHNATAVVAEVNQGGDMVRAVIHAVDPSVPVEKVRARQGKRARAEPVSTQYERGRWHHVGEFPLLEEQLTTWVPPEPGQPRGDSPDRLDALVYAATKVLPPEPEASISLPHTGGNSARTGARRAEGRPSPMANVRRSR